MPVFPQILTFRSNIEQLSNKSKSATPSGAYPRHLYGQIPPPPEERVSERAEAKSRLLI